MGTDIRLRILSLPALPPHAPLRPVAERGDRPAVPPMLRALRWALFGLLVAAVGLTLFVVPELRLAVAAGRWPRAALALPLVALAAFVLGFAFYRITLVRLGRYDGGKAFVHVVLMVLVLAVVAGIVVYPDEDPLLPRAVSLGRALHASDPTVRALAAEVARHRPREEALGLAGDLASLTEDPSAEVRRQARATLVALTGADAGGEGPGAAARWRTHLGIPSSR